MPVDNFHLIAPPGHLAPGSLACDIGGLSVFDRYSGPNRTCPCNLNTAQDIMMQMELDSTPTTESFLFINNRLTGGNFSACTEYLVQKS